jgi:SAM-dependent methyltransferase
MKPTDKRWDRHNQKIDAIPCDSIDFLKNKYFGKFVVMPFERNTKIMMNEIDLLIEHLPNLCNIKVLEVGAGFGNFCRLFQEKTKVIEYTILDTPSMLRFSKTFLGYYKTPCNFVETDKFKELLNSKFDLFVSNFCISETPAEYREQVLEDILPNCKYAFLIDGDGKNPKFDEWLENKLHKHFEKVCVQKIPKELCLQINQKVFVGEK